MPQVHEKEWRSSTRKCGVAERADSAFACGFRSDLPRRGAKWCCAFLVCFSGFCSWAVAHRFASKPTPKREEGKVPLRPPTEFCVARPSQPNPPNVAHRVIQSPGGSAACVADYSSQKIDAGHQPLDSNGVCHTTTPATPQLADRGPPCCQEGRLLGPGSRRPCAGRPPSGATSCTAAIGRWIWRQGAHTGLTVTRRRILHWVRRRELAGLKLTATPKRGPRWCSAIEAANEKAREGDYGVGVITSACLNEAETERGGAHGHAGHAFGLGMIGAPWWAARTRERSNRPASSPPAKSRMHGGTSPIQILRHPHSNEATTSPSRPLRSEEESLRERPGSVKCLPC